MENWEKQRREELSKIIENRAYTIKVGKIAFTTGKGGMIDFQIEMEKQLKQKQK